MFGDSSNACDCWTRGLSLSYIHIYIYTHNIHYYYSLFSFCLVIGRGKSPLDGDDALFTTEVPLRIRPVAGACRGVPPSVTLISCRTTLRQHGEVNLRPSGQPRDVLGSRQACLGCIRKSWEVGSGSLASAVYNHDTEEHVGRSRPEKPFYKFRG